jgi:formamidopyrimidine-DNA glycosylase
MPELPEVESFKNYIEQTSLYKRIKDVTVSNAMLLSGTSKECLRGTLIGNMMMGSRRHGKFLFIRHKKDLNLLFHFGMTGHLEYFPKGEPINKNAALLILFKDDSSLAFVDRRRLGKVGLIKNVDDFIKERGYGPDALQIDEKEFTERLKSKRTNIKTALMDQKLLAGVGNEYSDEILFQSRLHPESRINKLNMRLLHRVFENMQGILKKAVAENADRRKLSNYFFLEHRKAGLTCPPKCGGFTALKTIGGRSSYFCPGCQELIK